MNIVKTNIFDLSKSSRMKTNPQSRGKTLEKKRRRFAAKSPCPYCPYRSVIGVYYNRKVENLTSVLGLGMMEGWGVGSEIICW